MREVEVFRLTPELGKCYSTAEYTRKTGIYYNDEVHIGPDSQFFTTKPLRYVGRFLRTERYGSGDGRTTTSFFDDNGTINRVDYTYEGTTSFVEAPCQEPSNENRAKKAQMTSELKALPPMNQPSYPGGTNYLSSLGHFLQSRGGKMSRRNSRSKKSRTKKSRRGLKSKRV